MKTSALDLDRVPLHSLGLPFCILEVQAQSRAPRPVDVFGTAECAPIVQQEMVYSGILRGKLARLPFHKSGEGGWHCIFYSLHVPSRCSLYFIFELTKTN